MCTPVGVPAAPAEGGAVWDGMSTEFAYTAFTNNKATQGSGLPFTGGLARGGAIAVAEGGQLKGDHTPFDGNAAVRGHGGALSGGTVSVMMGIFTNNTAGSSGGAIQGESVLAQFVTASQNKAGGSGGGAIAATGDVLVDASRITQNSVDSLEGRAGGGGVFAGGALSVRYSDVSDNRGSVTRNLGGTFGTIPGTFTGGGVHGASVTAMFSPSRATKPTGSRRTAPCRCPPAKRPAAASRRPARSRSTTSRSAKIESRCLPRLHRRIRRSSRIAALLCSPRLCRSSTRPSPTTPVWKRSRSIN